MSSTVSDKTNILIVDDSPDKTLALQAILEDLPLHILTAQSGNDALRALLRNDVAVILMDVNMPGMDGFETASLIRQRKSTERTPIIFVSAISTTETHAARGYRLGAVDYIFAPVDPEVLRAKVTAFVELYRRNREVVVYARELETANQRLKDSQESFRAIVDASPDGLVILDEQSHVRFANPAALRIFGNDPDPLLGRGLPFSVDAGATHERELIAHDGTRMIIDVTCVPTHWEGRAATLVRTRDITTRKQEQEALRKMEENFRQSQKQEALGRLAGGVAHDFNNLLTAIRGYGELLLEEAGPGHPWYDQLEEIKKAADRGATLTNQLLIFTRRHVAAPRIMDLNDAVKGMAGMLSRLMADHAELQWELGSALHKIKVDPNQIEQVVMNLVVNARDAMPAGGTITVRTQNLDLSGHEGGWRLPILHRRYVALTVRDNGSGMDSDVQQRIFEPFFTTKEVGRGTGLGLSMVYGVVQSAEGTISVRSAPGEGTEFTICVPAVDSARTAQVLERAVLSRPPRRSLKGTALVVDDEPAVRNFVRQSLEQRGMTVLCAPDADHALRLARDHGGEIDLLVSDMVMPRMGGRELARTLVGQRPALRVLFISGYTDDQAVRAVSPEGAHAFLGKPFTPHVLMDKVHALLEAPPGSGLTLLEQPGGPARS